MAEGFPPNVIAGPQPRRDEFINPFDHRGWVDYFSRLLPRFDHIRFIGLPSLKDLPDVPLDRLYVPLDLGREYVGAERAEQAQRVSLAAALAERRRLIVLGDPGAGKSTLVSYLVATFAGKRRHELSEVLGPLIPLPFVLRDLKIGEGVTFDDLLRQLIGQPFWSPDLSRKDLEAVLEAGQGLILLDGLDEIGDVGRRKALRKAILEEGLRRYPRCAWVLTSRIVGYEDVPFDLLRGRLEEALVEAGEGWVEKAGFELPFLGRLYVLPFTTAQIQRFAENWYAFRERDPELREKGVESLLAALAASPSIERLAHIPNLLQMIALVHRVYTTLPFGKALLYDRITEAYLESIEQAKGTRSAFVLLKSQRRWLARLAFRMQQQRTPKSGESESILIQESDVLEAIRGELGPGWDAAAELSFIARRSGLLVPQGPGVFSFAHLSFQEYFAAIDLSQRLLSPRSQQAALEEAAQLLNRPVWHEVLVFVFEKLAEQEDLAEWFFEQLFKKSTPLKPEAALLAAELLGDEQSGLGPESRRRASRLILRQARKRYSEPLVSRVNALPPEIWASCFHPELEWDIASGPTPGPDALLFWQSLAYLQFEELEALLAAGPLGAVAAEELYVLTPLAWANDGPARREMVERLPMELWFAGWAANQPILAFAGSGGGGRFGFLHWCFEIDQLTDLLTTKLFAGSLNRTWALDRAQTRDRDQILALARDRAQALDQDRFLAQGLVQALPRDLDRVQALSLALSWALDRTRPLAQDWALKRARVVTLDRTMVLDRAESSGLPPASRAAIALLMNQSPPRGDAYLTSPEKLLWHLDRLVLGQGGPEDWWKIEQQAAVMAGREWQEEHLPFLKPGEMDIALDLLGLRRKTDGNLFQAHWFEPSHPLAKALNATPGELWAAVERLKKGGG